MAKARALEFLGAVALTLFLAGCGVTNMIGFAPPTPTVTKTPRPTFTLEPTLTATPEDTLTPIPTLTVAVKSPPTSTRRPAATPRPATPKPAAPPPPPAPAFTVGLVEGVPCPQGGPVWEIIARFNKSGSSAFLGGYILGLIGGDGKLLQSSQPSLPDDQVIQDFDLHCKISGWYRYNAKLDASAHRGQPGLKVRVIRAANDATPLSPDFPLDFSQSVRYFMLYNAP